MLLFTNGEEGNDEKAAFNSLKRGRASISFCGQSLKVLDDEHHVSHSNRAIKMKRCEICTLCALLSMLLANSAMAWKFGSYPDSHSSGWQAGRGTGCRSLDENTSAAFTKIMTEGCELGLVAGDMMSSDIFDDRFISPAIRDSYPSDELFVADVFKKIYKCYLDRIPPFGFKPVLCVGDHELANNSWAPGSRKAKAVPYMKKAFFDNLLHDSNGNSLYDGKIGTVNQRPIGTSYAGTSYAFIHKNVMFVKREGTIRM